MKKFVKNIIAFSFIFIVSNVLYLNLLKSFDWNFSKTEYFVNNNHNDLDILILGNSLAMDGINTQIIDNFGYNSYNASIGGANLYSNYIILKNQIDNGYIPKSVIFGMGQFLSENYDSTELHPIVNYYFNSEKKISLDDLPLYKFRWLSKELIKFLFSEDHRTAKIYKGHLQFKKVSYDLSVFNNTNIFEVENLTSSINFNKIVNLCNENNINLIIVEMPGWKLDQHFNVDKSKKYDRYDINDGILLLDFNNHDFYSIFPKDSWLTKSHLNNKGSIIFTKFLMNLLVDIDEL